MLSIIIPAYNEEERLPKTLNQVISFFNNKHVDHEIIVINDGSKDGTKKVIEDYAKKFSQVKLINNGINQGKGYSVRAGVNQAQGDLILFSDADLSTPIEEYDKLKSQLDAGFDIVIGSRRSKGADIRIKQPLHRRFLGKSFGLLVQILAVKGIRDTQCGFKLFKQEIAKKVFPLQKINRFSFDVEVLFIAQKKFNAEIKEVPVTWIDSAERSTVNAGKETFRMLKDLIKIRLIH